MQGEVLALRAQLREKETLVQELEAAGSSGGALRWAALAFLSFTKLDTNKGMQLVPSFLHAPLSGCFMMQRCTQSFMHRIEKQSCGLGQLSSSTAATMAHTVLKYSSPLSSSCQP